ncbi:hypothetical protein P1X15_21375 [Runella sp. MFBS21]|uniref:hypothetical protein n=1 Tax=Runella sp. MFBS21 TaxID=3034018 RepID=UPI0023F8D21A|nr:hypothetical protein [Runella sp. MFBS21]MDF7820185.1 hypothetical protein [Runella sp. MFBS21]
MEELESIQHPSPPIPLIVRDEHFEAEYLMSVYGGSMAAPEYHRESSTVTASISKITTIT